MRCSPSTTIQLLLLLLGTDLVIGQNNDGGIIFDLDDYYNKSNRSRGDDVNSKTGNEESGKCVLPPMPADGYYDTIGEAAKVGDLVDGSTSLVYTCNDGFDVHTHDPDFNAIVVCENGKWSHNVQCKKKTVQSSGCPLPDNPSNGYYLVLGGSGNIGDIVPFGTHLSYSCDRDYILTGSGLVSCNNDGKWSSEIICRSFDTNKPTRPPVRITTTTTTTRTAVLGRNSCITPPNPNNGSYLTNGKVRPVGVVVDEYTLLYYRCNEDFVVDQDEPTSVCMGGEWVPKVTCKRTCKNPTSYTLDFSCTYRGKRIDCNGSIRDDTILIMSCKTFFKKPKIGVLKTLICNDGKWSGTLPHCEPECGEDKSLAGELALDAKKTRVNSSPWHIGIYERVRGKYEYRCGGSIITNKVIITAAHCFKVDSKKNINYNSYKITVGKYYSDWDNEVDDDKDYVKKFEIEKVYIPDTYRGHELFMQSDVAVIILKEVIEFSNSVHAICIDLNVLVAHSLLTNGRNGKVVGWGVTIEGDLKSVSKELKESIVPVVNRDICHSGVPRSFQKYTQVVDKFCAGVLEKGPTVCTGDSGGGFTIKVSEIDAEKWYLFGIVSVGPIEDDTGITCKNNSYTLYTDVSKHSDFILNIISDYIK